MNFIYYQFGSALVIVHAEAFGADGTLVNRLPFNISDQLALLVLIRTVDKHERFNVINRGYDFFRRQQQRQTHQTLNDVPDVLITSVHLFQADFVGALDNKLIMLAHSGANTRLR